jgi:hypothetical protein
MRDYGKSRLELYEATERQALLPLPTDPFEITEWKKAVRTRRAPSGGS